MFDVVFIFLTLYDCSAVAMRSCVRFCVPVQLHDSTEGVISMIIPKLPKIGFSKCLKSTGKVFIKSL